MYVAVTSIMTQLWPWGSQIVVRKKQRRTYVIYRYTWKALDRNSDGKQKGVNSGKPLTFFHKSFIIAFERVLNIPLTHNEPFCNIRELIIKCYTFFEAVIRRCSIKMIFLKFRKNSQENNCVGVFFSIKLQASPQLH